MTEQLDLYYADGRQFGFVDAASGAIHDLDGCWRGWAEPNGDAFRADGQYVGRLDREGYLLRDPARPAPPPREPPPPAAPRLPARLDHANRGTYRLRGTGLVDALPELAAIPPNSDPPCGSASPAPGRKLVVLVAVEEARRRQAVGDALADAGYAVLEAGDGDEAMACARGRVGPVDLLLADLHLPGAMTGAALARRLIGWHPGLRALFMDREAERAEPEEEGGELYAVLRTPVRPDELVRAVRAVLGRD